jgi:peptidoglycan/xylan/chitin deacetylase (PgdA/CDA1 family)
MRVNPSRRLQNFDEWLKLEGSFGFKSTFFFFPSRLDHRHPYDCWYQFHDIVRHGMGTMTVKEMIRAIDLAGWEVGLHGSYHSATERDLLSHERQQLEEILDHDIISTRQHWLHYEVQVTPGLQREAGFKVDSTQGLNRSIGFRAGTAFPYWCWDYQKGESLPVLEVPQHIMDAGLFAPNGLQYKEALAIKHSMEIMDAVESVGGCLTLNWHPHNVNDAKHWHVYKTLLEEANRRNAWGCSVGELYQWWTNRERRIIGLELAGTLATNRKTTAV